MSAGAAFLAHSDATRNSTSSPFHSHKPAVVARISRAMVDFPQFMAHQQVSSWVQAVGPEPSPVSGTLARADRFSLVTRPLTHRAGRPVLATSLTNEPFESTAAHTISPTADVREIVGG